MAFRDEGICWESEEATALCDAGRIRNRSRPQSSEAEHILNVRVNIVWLFPCVRIDMPFIETQCRNNAAATSFPQLSKIGAGRQRLNRSIETAARGKSPAHHDDRRLAFGGANDGNNL